MYSKNQHCGLGMGEFYFQEPLPVHHQANKNILHAQIHQQPLLLHQPALIRFLRGGISLEPYTARAKCIASANTALSVFSDLEDPQFMPNKWYTSGLGILHRCNFWLAPMSTLPVSCIYHKSTCDGTHE